MFQSKFTSTLISMTLAFTLLISALVASNIAPTRALPPTEFTMNAILSPDPFWGYYGGYWAIWDEWGPELAKIGIDLDKHYQGDIYAIWELCWSPSVPEGGYPGGSPPHAWDAIIMEWWTQPQGMLWMDAIALSQNLVNGPLGGVNIQPYLSQASDEFYWGMQTTFDANARKAYADLWQAQLFHDAPWISIYSPHTYDVQGVYFEGYNGYCWTTNVNHVRINRTKVYQMHEADELSDAAYNRLYNQKVVQYAASEAWWNFLPPYVDSYTEEEFQALLFHTLYRMSVDPWPTEDNPAAPPTDYEVIPWLAASDPINLGWEPDSTDGKQVYRVRIPLRTGVQWSDGHKFNATDVEWTINDIILDFSLGCTATGDFAPVVKRAEIHDEYTVDLILYEPYVDLTLILANDWGQAIVPYHHFDGVPPTITHPANKKMTGPTGAVNVPTLGPMKYKDEGPSPGYSWLELEKNPNYFGYGLGWGPYDVDGWIFKYTPEASQRLLDLQTHTCDYGEYPTSPVEVFEGFMDDPGFKAYTDFYPSVNPLWLNFNNIVISNRYVRQAIAHTIPYNDIYKDVLPSWGVIEPIPGGSLIHPFQYYQGIQLWNTELPIYTYNIAKAQKYLDMWRYSQDYITRPGNELPANYNKGPVGDANFDGKVDLDDLYEWYDTYGTAPLTKQIDWLDPSWTTGGGYPWPAGSGCSLAPGNDIDADFDNSNDVTLADYDLWYANVGKVYPFAGAF